MQRELGGGVGALHCRRLVAEKAADVAGGDATLLKDMDVELDRAIKTSGDHEVTLSFPYDVSATETVSVAPEEKETEEK